MPDDLIRKYRKHHECDPSRCVPPEVKDLTFSEQLVEGQLEVDRAMLKLRYSLEQVPDDSAPPIIEEQAVIDGEKRLAVLDGQIRSALKGACMRCPGRRTCGASMAR